MGQLAPDDAALFTRWDAVGEDMWLPIMFSPSKESQAAGRSFINRITARTEDRDIPVSDSTITAYRAAASQWGAPADGSFDYLEPNRPTHLDRQRQQRHHHPDHQLVPPVRDTFRTPNSGCSLTPTTALTSNTRRSSPAEVIDFLDIQPQETAP